MDRNLSKNVTPDCKPDEILCEELKDYFHQKVQEIYSNFDQRDTADSHLLNESATPSANHEWNKFQAITEDELDGIIKDLNKKECEEDPIPVKLLVQCLETIRPIILFIVNDSLKNGVFPEALKSALVRPSIKDENGDVMLIVTKTTDLLAICLFCPKLLRKVFTDSWKPISNVIIFMLNFKVATSLTTAVKQPHLLSTMTFFV